MEQPLTCSSGQPQPQATEPREAQTALATTAESTQRAGLSRGPRVGSSLHPETHRGSTMRVPPLPCHWPGTGGSQLVACSGVEPCGPQDISVPTGSQVPRLWTVTLCVPRLCLPANPLMPGQHLPGWGRKTTARPPASQNRMRWWAA